MSLCNIGLKCLNALKLRITIFSYSYISSSNLQLKKLMQFYNF